MIVHEFEVTHHDGTRHEVSVGIPVDKRVFLKPKDFRGSSARYSVEELVRKWMAHLGYPKVRVLVDGKWKDAP